MIVLMGGGSPYGGKTIFNTNFRSNYRIIGRSDHYGGHGPPYKTIKLPFFKGGLEADLNQTPPFPRGAFGPDFQYSSLLPRGASRTYFKT